MQRIINYVFQIGLLGLGIISIIGSGCGGGGDGGGGSTSTVTVTSPTLTPYEGDTLQLTAIARDQSGNVLSGKTVTWTSSRPDIAPVSTSGVLNTWGVGSVTVTANVDGVIGAATLSLTPILATVAFGSKEVVFDYTSDRCDDLDLPDQPPRIVRGEDGNLVMFAGDAPQYFVSRGADFGSLQRDCSQPALESAALSTPESYQGYEWIWSVYREGALWHGLLLNEWYDAVSGACLPGEFSPGNPCVYNSVTHALSSDGARTFTKPQAPAHVIAPPIDVWTPPNASTEPRPWGPPYSEGYTLPTNLVRRDDGYYYAMISLIPDKADWQRNGACLIRTRTLDDPTSWRAWDGSAFTVEMQSPYVTGVAGEICAFLPQPVGLANLYYSSYFERYITVINASKQIGGREVCGFYFQLSSDLVHWSDLQFLVETSLQDCQADPGQPNVLETLPVIFPALVDHADLTANFEKVGRTPHLYYVRFNSGNLDRDVVRVPLTFTKTN